MSGSCSSLFTLTATPLSRSKGKRALSSTAGKRERNAGIGCPSTLLAP
jgi:hypothetical protein